MLLQMIHGDRIKKSSCYSMSLWAVTLMYQRLTAKIFANGKPHCLGGL